MRRAFMAFFWPADSAAAGGRVDHYRALMAAEPGWREAFAGRGAGLWLRQDQPLSWRPVGANAALIGDIFGDGPLAADLGADDLPAFARRLSRERWGRYVLLGRAAGASAPIIFRDPSGMLPCVTWRLEEGVWAAASDFTHAPSGVGPRRGYLNWDRITAFLAAPAAAMTAPLFDDVEVAPPGELLHLEDKGLRRDLIWTPADFARNGHSDLAAVARGAVERLDHCVSHLVGGYDRVVVELSGGLDSSILGGAIGAVGQSDRVAAWLNYQDDRPEADESAYARAVTDRLGVSLVTPRDWAVPIDAAALKEIGVHAWPSIGGIDAGRDRDEDQRLKSLGATAIVSGQGGDGVFFQYPTALVMADALQRDGYRALLSPRLAAIARRTRQSVWSVLRQVRADRQRQRRPRLASSLLSRVAAVAGATAEHPWVAEARARGLPPAKVLHIQGIAVTNLYRGASRRLATADILLPLFAQPLVEHCLSIAVPDLAGESYDRPFARRAFGDRLPEIVRERRSKGDMSTYFGKLVGISLPTLRPYLLDGCLADAGLLDRPKLDYTLTVEGLIAGGGGAAMDVLNAAAVEAWVRHWQTQAPDSLTAARHRRSA